MSVSFVGSELQNRVLSPETGLSFLMMILGFTQLSVAVLFQHLHSKVNLVF